MDIKVNITDTLYIDELTYEEDTEGVFGALGRFLYAILDNILCIKKHID